jgi:2-hydroxycyclohexanecarboxyl-CoA dehydrogenase
VKITPGMTGLVTGAGSGIGRATAVALARRGVVVHCVDIDGVAAKTTAQECDAVTPGATAHTCDVADAEAVDQLGAAVIDLSGPLHILVNNAGVGMSGRFLDTAPEDWDWILGVNLHGVINGCRAFGGPMVTAGRGHVVNVSSGLAYTPTDTEPAYCTSKAAVLQLSRCLRYDWASSGVGVTAVCPGVIDTPIVEGTRFLGERTEAQPKVERLFSRGHAPELVARGILESIERDRAVAPVGAEAWLGWALARLLPLRAADQLSRLQRLI